MLSAKRVAGGKTFQESLAPAFKELGIEFLPFNNVDEAIRTQADCFLLDARDKQDWKDLSKLKSKTSVPILSLVNDSVRRDELLELRNNGSEGYLRENTPAEEIVVRIRAMLADVGDNQIPTEVRAARRFWFQQSVEFRIFERWHKAWSTTLSETGVFLRTSLSFPLYTVILLKFQLLGDPTPFECSGVIVRQEVEGDIRGVGIMFQNLSGDAVRRLESFLEIYK